jgi:ABC-type transport system involved in multi-copper enzyme maturation permease subunit
MTLAKVKSVFSRKGTGIQEEEKSKNMLLLVKKTFQDLASLKKFLISLIVMLIPLIITIAFPSTIEYQSISPQHAAAAISITIIFLLFFWTLGIAYTCIIGSIGASLISEEIHSGTMLILVSKPIQRIKIFLGKFLGLFLYGAILSFIAIFSIGWIAVLRYSGNLHHFYGLIPFLFATYVYSLILLLIFCSITLALSSIVKKPRNAGLLVIFLVIFSFLGMMILKMFLADNYETYYLFTIDLGYHLANIYIGILEVFSAIPPVAEWQNWFAMFMGVYEVTSPTDPDQDINPGGMIRTDYVYPWVSLLIWIGITVFLLIYGLISLKKREISV